MLLFKFFSPYFSHFKTKSFLTYNLIKNKNQPIELPSNYILISQVNNLKNISLNGAITPFEYFFAFGGEIEFSMGPGFRATVINMGKKSNIYIKWLLKNYYMQNIKQIGSNLP